MKLASRKTLFIWGLFFLPVLVGFQNCSSSKSDSSSPASPSPAPSPENASLFWVEPTTQTTIGVGQIINIYSALKSSSSALYPSYLNASSVTYSSSSPGVASVNSSGSVAGISEGTTTITALYLGYSSQLTVKVSGSMQQRTVSVTGQGNRTYSIYVPPFGSDNDPHPLLLSLHGGGGSAMIQAASTLLNKFAEEQKFYVAYLEGTGAIKTFNGGACCGSAQSQNINDVNYARAVLDDIEAHYSVNTNKIFASGFSNGAIMSHRLACEMADRLSGIAAVSGGSGEFDGNLNQYYTCSPSRPIRVLHIHAKNDRNYPINGGVGAGISNTPFYPVQSTISDWISRNNVTTSATVVNVTSTTKCYLYNTVANSNLASAPVQLCLIDPPDVYDSTNEIVFGGGHSWPGGVRSPSANSDVPVQDFNANSFLWTFLN